MSDTLTFDPCVEAGCLVPPAEFVRLRYFFGQRLGVVDLADEQSYVIGKQRFHNWLAHGAGVLCGLRAFRYVFPQGSPPATATTMLRVSRGAALDTCGREIVVGWDQCIDVAAWFIQHPAAAKAAVDGSVRLWIALRYRECPSDPAPAPRDPCGCDPGGCEMARVREGFELTLLTDAEAKACFVPTKDAPLPMLLAGADCPEPAPDACLLLASFEATLDAAGKTVLDITALDNAIPERRTLLRTEVLQRLLLDTAASSIDSGLTGEGPRLTALGFENGGADSGTLTVAVELNGSPLSQSPFAPSTPLLAIHVSQFKDDGTWTAAPSFTPAYVTAPSPQVQIAWAVGAGLVDGGRYRVLIETDHAQPPVDQKMRPLTPSSWARHFRLAADGGVLALADSLYPA